MCKLRYIVSFFLLFSFIPGSRAYSNLSADSLGLTEVIQQVINNYPSIIKAEQDIEAANARIGLAKSAYYPLINVSASYTRLGPLTKLTVPTLGSFTMNSANNYDMGLNYNQRIYDFGKTSGKVDLEKQNKLLSQLSVEQLKQQLSLSLLNQYYSILYLQEAIMIKDEELKTLGEHLTFVEKQEATGTSTQYAILSTKVRISATENQKIDLQTSLQVLQAQLNSFLGNPQEQPLSVKKELLQPTVLEPNEKLISNAYQLREELKIAHQRSEIASTRYRLAGIANYPEFDLYASGGYKNGYFPDLNKLILNYVAGISFKFPIFDGNKVKYNRQQAQSEIKSTEQDTELTNRNIANEVIENKANVDAALKKIMQQELQLKQAQQAFELAQTSFQAGTVTNLDLLDSQTALAESRLDLMKSRIDYTVSLLKLKISTGEHIY
ncbi:MAG: TolC family protein [Candidatus Azobacteroides sp.]|nr:TolC family protein [Candidatus Azobacteroides sp.]